MEIFITFFIEFISLFNEMAIYLIIGFFFAGLIHLFFPDSFIEKHLGKNNFSSIFKASTIGIPLPICSCGVIPVATSLRNKGASKGSTASFLISTPQIGVDSFLVTFSLIGWIFGLFRIVASFITSIAAGFITNLTEKDENKETIKQFKFKKTDSIKSRWKHFFKYIQYDTFGPIARYLFIGLILAAAITTFIPETFFEQYFSNQFLSMLLMLVVGVPLYVCAVSSTPIAASLIMKGISPGAALVFLLTGPATNAITITTVNKLLGRKVAFIYIGSIAIVSIILGFILNYLAFNGIVSMGHDHIRFLNNPIIQYIGTTLLISMFSFHIFNLVINKFRHSNNTTIGENEMYVEGMTCNHCVSRVKKAAEDSGAKDVVVNLKKGKISFSSGEKNSIRSAIKDAGYETK